MGKWQDILRDEVKGDTIRLAALRKVPQLKDCPRWDLAEFLGCVNYRMPFATYDGGLVKYGGRLYYVSRAQMDALRPFVHWNTKKQLVILDSEGA